MAEPTKRVTGCTGCQHRWPLANKSEVDGKAWIKCLETGRELLEREPGECPVRTYVGFMPKADK